MLKSMTAYGRASVMTSLGHFVAEIQSVNRKYLEINCFLPKELLRFEADIKKQIGTAVGRGAVNVRLTVFYEGSTPVEVTPNLPLAKQYKKAWDAIAQELGLNPEKSFNLSLLAKESSILNFNEEFQNQELYQQAISDVLDLALRELVKMKLSEGEVLYQDISQRIALLHKAVEKIRVKSPEATTRYRQKLMDRLTELIPNSFIENEEKVLREVAVYAERIDIAEEITRFQSHLAQLNKLIHSDATSIGKTFEFIVQELNREANTIGSKSSDVEVSHLVVEIKSELERMREQIQNIE